MIRKCYRCKKEFGETMWSMEWRCENCGEYNL
jgi:DNA-directed RNA polymerase subunit RPC12/RpoP